MPHKKFCFLFSEGSIDDKALLGNKGGNLCEMYRLNMPVPPGFVISTEACLEYLGMDKEKSDSTQLDRLPDHLIHEYTIKVHEIERQTHRLFGGTAKSKAKDSNIPLLLSVRSGASVSMPG